MLLEAELRELMQDDEFLAPRRHVPEEASSSNPVTECRVLSVSPPLNRSPRAASPPPEPCRAPSRQSEGSTADLSLEGMSLAATPPMADVSPSPPAAVGETHNLQVTNQTIHGASPHSLGQSQRQTEEEESIALARMLMAQEAMESYVLSTDQLRYNQDLYSAEDYAALQAAMAGEEPEAYESNEDSSERELSYDAMLRLGESIGDVKSERWALEANDHIVKLPSFEFEPASAKGKDENDSSVKCLVCQCPYEEGECLRMLPCGHCFHKECVDQWLKRTDVCAYCRQSILPQQASCVNCPK